MTNKIIVKEKFFDKEIRIFGNAIDPLFLAKDIADWIEHSDVEVMCRMLDDDEKIIIKINPTEQSTEGIQVNTNYIFVNENGLYRILMRSNKPQAKPFQKEVAKMLKELRLQNSSQYDALSQILQIPSTKTQLKRNEMLESIGWSEGDINIRQLTARTNTVLRKILSKYDLNKFQFIKIQKIVNEKILGMSASEIKKKAGVSENYETRNVLPENISLFNLLIVETKLIENFNKFNELNYENIKDIVSRICNDVKSIGNSQISIESTQIDNYMVV